MGSLALELTLQNYSSAWNPLSCTASQVPYEHDTYVTLLISLFTHHWSADPLVVAVAGVWDCAASLWQQQALINRAWSHSLRHCCFSMKLMITTVPRVLGPTFWVAVRSRTPGVHPRVVARHCLPGVHWLRRWRDGVANVGSLSSSWEQTYGQQH